MQSQLNSSLVLNPSIITNLLDLKSENKELSKKLSETTKFNTVLQQEVDRLLLLEKELALERKEKKYIQKALKERIAGSKAGSSNYGDTRGGSGELVLSRGVSGQTRVEEGEGMG